MEILLVFMLIGCIFFLFIEIPATKDRIKREKEEKRKDQEISKNYNFSIRIGKDFVIDPNKKVFKTNASVIPLENIQLCTIRYVIARKSSAFKQGLKDGMIASMTGVGIIRNANSMYDETTGAELIIDYIDNSNISRKVQFIVHSDQFFNYIERSKIVEAPEPRIINY